MTMFERKCKICGNSQHLFILKIEETDDTDEQEYFVCNSCWEIIATKIAEKVVQGIIPKVAQP